MLKSALLVTTGIVLGAGAISALQAQTNAQYYTVAEINVKDRAAYEKDLPAAINIIKEGGGKYLAGGFDKATTRMGTPPVANRYVIQVYPNKAAADKTWDSGGLGAWTSQHKNIADFRVIEVEAVQ